MGSEKENKVRIKERMEGRRELEKKLSKYSWYQEDLQKLQAEIKEHPAKIKRIESSNLPENQKEIALLLQKAAVRGMAKTFRRKYDFSPGEPVKIIPYDEREYSTPEGNIIFEIDPRSPLPDIKYSIEVLLIELFGGWKINQRLRPVERIKALEVYDLWEKMGVSGKVSFPKIAKQVKVPVTTIKARWMKGHELHHGEAYNSKAFKKERRGLAVEFCAKCEKPDCYKKIGKNMNYEPCPQYIALLRQAGQGGYQREFGNKEAINLETPEDILIEKEESKK